MLIDLTKDQKELADYMSELSEEAYCAGWIDGLEHTLWKAKQGHLDNFGRLQITQEIIEKLNLLSERANGWIIFDGEREETFVSFEAWKEKTNANN